MPAHDATRESWATSHRPIFGIVSLSQARTFCETCSVQACSVSLAGGGVGTMFAWPSGVIVTGMLVEATELDVFVFDDGKSRPRHVSRNGRLDIQLLRSVWSL